MILLFWFLLSLSFTIVRSSRQESRFFSTKFWAFLVLINLLVFSWNIMNFPSLWHTLSIHISHIRCSTETSFTSCKVCCVLIQSLWLGFFKKIQHISIQSIKRNDSNSNATKFNSHSSFSSLIKNVFGSEALNLTKKVIA